ncbi:MAG: hypothetical protein VX246_15920 [Myxococcota bacterium]|nr:hypothetical protein [Myxococcota bacterium]
MPVPVLSPDGLPRLVPRRDVFAVAASTLMIPVENAVCELGHDIIGFDEEALVHLPAEHYYARRAEEQGDFMRRTADETLARARQLTAGLVS